jgi:molybdenum cofactor guanylyltransferase
MAAMPDDNDPRTQITGLVLAGGRGSRMGGIDKGLQVLGTRTLVEHALERLRPQVSALAINANRHLEAYARFGVPVWPDAEADYPGPLAGMLAGLQACTTEWLVTVPCDTPALPPDLVARLFAAAQAAGLRVAMPVTDEAAGHGAADGPIGRINPPPIAQYLNSGILATGSSAGLVSLLTAASYQQKARTPRRSACLRRRAHTGSPGRGAIRQRHHVARAHAQRGQLQRVQQATGSGSIASSTRRGASCCRCASARAGGR